MRLSLTVQRPLYERLRGRLGRRVARHIFDWTCLLLRRMNWRIERYLAKPTRPWYDAWKFTCRRCYAEFGRRSPGRRRTLKDNEASLPSTPHSAFQHISPITDDYSGHSGLFASIGILENTLEISQFGHLFWTWRRLCCGVPKDSKTRMKTFTTALDSDSLQRPAPACRSPTMSEDGS